MHLTFTPITLNLKTTWRIAHGASDQRHNVVVRLYETDDGRTSFAPDPAGRVGLGEGAGVPHHGESQAGILAYLAALPPHLWSGKLEQSSQSGVFLADTLACLPPGSLAARCALDLALHDLWGKQLGQPLYRLLGLNPQRLPPTSFTIAMDQPAVMAERARESGYPIIKIKLGSLDDEAIVAAIRSAVPSATRLRVDANAGWTRDQAASLIPRLAEFDLELVEQPLSPGDVEGLRWLKAQKFGLPIYADEPIKSARDVAAHAGAVDGVVIKLMKTSGLRGALDAIAVAHAHDMQVMLSCMVESSLCVTAAAHLAPLCEQVDLDGPLLVSNDPFIGVRYEGARLQLPTGPGLGVIEKNETLSKES